jgi:hypothetical protein
MSTPIISPASVPVTLAEITPEWIAERREIIVRDGFATRGRAETRTIEVKSLTLDIWFRLTLPNGGYEFATAADRDAVLKQIQGGR